MLFTSSICNAYWNYSFKKDNIEISNQSTATITILKNNDRVVSVWIRKITSIDLFHIDTTKTFTAFNCTEKTIGEYEYDYFGSHIDPDSLEYELMEYICNLAFPVLGKKPHKRK